MSRGLNSPQDLPAVLLPSDQVSPATSSRAQVSDACAVGVESFRLISCANENDLNIAKNLMKSGKTAGFFPHGLFKPEAIFFDMDATLIEEESLVEIARAVNKVEEIEHLTTQAMNGGMKFAESLQLRLSILKGVKREVVDSIRPTLMPGALELCRFAREMNIKCFLVTGGFTVTASKVAEMLKLDEYCANEFGWMGDVLSGEVVGSIVDAKGKKTAINAWANEHQLDLMRCMAVGDGANDLPMLKSVGISIGIKPKPILWEHVNLINMTGDHTLLKYLIATI
jgi:phosphoserine phosphatase